MRAAGWVIDAVIVGAEGLQEDFRAIERCLRRREVVLHRVQACQVLKYNGLSKGMVPDLER